MCFSPVAQFKHRGFFQRLNIIADTRTCAVKTHSSVHKESVSTEKGEESVTSFDRPTDAMCKKSFVTISGMQSRQAWEYMQRQSEEHEAEITGLYNWRLLCYF